MYVGACKCKPVPRGTLGGLGLSDSGGSGYTDRGGSGGTTATASNSNRVKGSSCPAGYSKVGGGKDYTVFPIKDYSLCQPIPKAAAPAPAPAPNINVSPSITTAISPNLQQQFTPQVSPVFQQSSGSGGQSAGTTQQAGGGQSGGGGGAGAPGASVPTTGQGLTAADLLSVLNQQADQQRREREAAEAQAEQRRRDEQDYYARAAEQQAAMSVHSQYTGPADAGISTQESSAPLPMVVQPTKNRYILPATAAIILTLAGVYIVSSKKGRKK